VTEALAQTVPQMGMTNYQPLCSYAVMRYAFHNLRIFPLRTLYRRYELTHVSYANSVTRFIWRLLCSIHGAVLGRCGN